MAPSPFWMSIEVLDGSYSGWRWAEAWGDLLAESALSSGAIDWAWHRHDWGVVFEVAFADESAWEQFSASDAMQAALDAVPDAAAVIIYRGRGGSAGTRDPRRPRPLAGSGAAALPLPTDPILDDDWNAFTTDVDRRRLTLTRS